jgi:hypothetical protein
LKTNNEGQVHILEMLTLFWLFFMSATFLIRVQVPDAESVAFDASLELAAEDSLNYGLGLEANIEGESRLHELLANEQHDQACALLQSVIASGKEANCWLAKDSSMSIPYGTVGNPYGNTISVHRLLNVDGHLWTVTLDVWSRGGGV